MEAWLLADAKAISSVSSLRSGWSVPPVHGELEDIVDPKDRLIRLLSEAKLPYDAEVCREIASRVSIETLKYRCRSFRSFEEKVTDC